MSSASARQSTFAFAPAIDPPEPITGRIRIAIASRRSGLAAKHPAAVALAADVLAAVAHPLRGVAALLAGVHTPRHWLRMLSGERGTALEDFARLASEPGSEPRRAYREGLTVFAAAIGCRLLPNAVPSRPPHEAVAGVAIGAGSLVANLTLALRDGPLSAAEATEAESHFAVLRDAVETIGALLAAARAA